MLLHYISIPVFLISFAIGLFFIYVLGPEMKKVYIYPNPETIDKVLFKDKTNSCFYFEEEKVECPTNTSLISNIPIQA